MVKRHRGGRKRGVGGRGVTPPIASTPKRSNPQEEEMNVEEEHIVVGDVVSMMRSFERMPEVLINHLDRDEGRASIPNEGSQRDPAGSSSIH
jgi:hypothetical protein